MKVFGSGSRAAWLLRLAGLTILLGGAPAAVSLRGQLPTPTPANPREGLFAKISTPRGEIVCELFFRQAPLTVMNFVGLAEGAFGPEPRRRFFDGLKFHRVVPGFVIQGGDPLGTGEGGPGYTFPDEFVAGLRHDAVGILSMANGGPDTNGSQFFLTLAPVPRLNYLHSVFGRAISGLDVLAKIQAGDAMTVTIERQGADAAKFRPDEAAFARLCAQTPRASPLAFDDPGGLLQSDPPRAKTLNFKLENFARFQGHKLFLRLYENFAPDSTASDPAAWTKNLASDLRLRTDDTLVVYFAIPGRVGIYAPARPALRAPSPKAEAPTTAALTPESEIALKKKRLAAVNEIADAIIDQLERTEIAPNRGK